jgi:hypothetical protein
VGAADAVAETEDTEGAADTTGEETGWPESVGAGAAVEEGAAPEASLVLARGAPR